MEDYNSSPSTPSPSNVAPPVPLPPAVDQAISRIRAQRSLPDLGSKARATLLQVGPEIALNRVLNSVATWKVPIWSFDGLVLHLCKPYLNPNPNPNGAASQLPSSPSKRLCFSPPSTTPTPTRLMMMTSPQDKEDGTVSPQLRALGELEFRRAFLILSYLGWCKLEEVVAAEWIREINGLEMRSFEDEVWRKVGWKCGYIKEFERLKHFNWETEKAYIYHCHVCSDLSYRFKGPYVDPKRNFLQKALGDDNVLMVKFKEDVSEESTSANNALEEFTKYIKVLRDGILVGLRRYRFFAFKDEGKDPSRKKKNGSQEEKSTSPTGVKCFFVRTESHALVDKKDYILDGKTVREARALFMHVDSLKNLSSYMARLSLVLSKTDNVEVDFSTVRIQVEDDIPCRDGNGNYVYEKGVKEKHRIHTDGTGFISEDLAFKCVKAVHQKKPSIGGILEPLLIQFRLFHKGTAVKGTFLVNKKLQPSTFVVRPSMIKVYEDKELSNMPSENSLNGFKQERDSLSALGIVGTSNRPRTASLSRNLIALLSYGGVPHEIFTKMLSNALEDANSTLKKKHTALRAAFNRCEENLSEEAHMLFSDIPLEESHLQHTFCSMMMEEKKNLKAGKIPVPESYYLMGTSYSYPTGGLESGEVCVILENGQVSGKVLVYRNPGLHVGDIHILNARYVPELEDYIGNSKYGIFFSSKGPRSIADEIAGGDFDGDMYFVSRNPQLLENFKQSEPWTSASLICSPTMKGPREFSDNELEDELFKLFWTSRFQRSHTIGLASDSWLALMDRMLTLGDDSSPEKARIMESIARLIDIYYDALDAPKKGGMKIEVPDELKAELYPHYMERNNEMSYKSSSILGIIYDQVKAYEEQMPRTVEVQKLPCFESEEINENSRIKWENLYAEYRKEMACAIKSSQEKSKNEAANEVIKKYKKELYDAAEYEETTRNKQDILQEALAIYHIVYDLARSNSQPAKCGFAWKVAGPVLREYYMKKNGVKTVTVTTSVSTLKNLL